ncbi:nucleoside-triphosphatase [Eubacteriales bacterium OttesenSCG-928-A19]|nr:nucleoside-triphosphatase [Eubacteriales bacterium OttesenSCG-928-A19]
MHIFLTGPLQSGKSTLIRHVQSECPGAGGFYTYFPPENRWNPDKKLYLCKPDENFPIDEGRVVVTFHAGCPTVRTERFDALGAQFLSASHRQGCPLILMDECGRLEQDALRFQKEVLDTLDGDIPVLGVVRHDAGGWTDRVRAHPKVRVLTVSLENRDSLRAYLLKWVRRY